MDKVSPDFGLTVVETRSWTDGDCDQVDDHNIDISTSSPGAFTTSCHIAEAHSVVDVNSIALDDGCAPTEETDCSVAEVFTPRISAKLEDVSSKSTLSSPCDPAETAALPSPSCNIGADGLVKAVEPIQPNASADAIPSPMLFGSFVAPGKADPNIVVQLEGADLWHQFYQAGTEMIITKSGR